MNYKRTLTDNGAVIGNTYIADTPFLRLRGLLMRPPLDDDSALLITPCNSVHTLFMMYPIDVIFIDESHNIVKIVENLKPWRIAFCFRAKQVLELRSNGVKDNGFELGDRVSFC